MKFVFETSVERIPEKDVLLVKIKIDDVEGWGECTAGSGPYYAYEHVEADAITIRRFLAPLIVDREFSKPEEIRMELEKIRGWNMAKHAIETAIWDAYCKILNVPLWKMLGGIRDEIICGVSIGIKDSVDELISEISRELNNYARIKIKIKPGWDVEIVKKIRKDLGDIPLQVDANGAYTLEHAKMFKELDKYHLIMIEQPLHYEDLSDHAELQKILKTPICLDESIKNVYNMKAAIKLGSCKIVNIKPGRVGGIVEAKKIHDICMQNNIGNWIGGMLETGIGRSVLVAMATLPNIKYASDITPPTRYLKEDIVDEDFELRKGRMKTFKDAGIGVHINENKLRKYLVKAWRVF